MPSLISVKSNLSEQISIREGKVYWIALLNKPGVIRSLYDFSGNIEVWCEHARMTSSLTRNNMVRHSVQHDFAL